MKTNIYTLQLKNNKYYVGKTRQDIEKRFEQHLNGSSALWTKIHKPIKILKIIPNVSSFEEDKIVKEYMSKYGINNVRGGSYILPNLTCNEIEFLTKEIRMANDLCIKCGNKGHFVTNCEFIENDEEEIIYECEICKKEFTYENECQKHLETCEIKKDVSIQTDYEIVRKCCIIL